MSQENRVNELGLGDHDWGWPKAGLVSFVFWLALVGMVGTAALSETMKLSEGVVGGFLKVWSELEDESGSATAVGQGNEVDAIGINLPDFRRFLDEEGLASKITEVLPDSIASAEHWAEIGNRIIAVCTDINQPELRSVLQTVAQETDEEPIEGGLSPADATSILAWLGPVPTEIERQVVGAHKASIDQLFGCSA